MAARGGKVNEKRRIVVIGGGLGGTYCAQTLTRKLRRSNAEVLLIDRNNYFVFCPLLVEAGTGRPSVLSRLSVAGASSDHAAAGAGPTAP